MDSAAERVWRIALALGAAGTVVAWAWRGWQDGGGFALGAILSALNYRWLKRTVDLLGAGERPKRASGAVLSLRYLILGVAAYATLTVFKLGLLAVLAGLLVTVAAVILEIVYELSFSK